MSDTRRPTIVVTNYNMALARFAVVVLLTPLLAGASAFALAGIQGTLAYGSAALFLLLLLGLWMTAARLICSVRLGEHLEIRRTFGVRRYPFHDLTSVRQDRIGSIFTTTWPRRHRLLVFQLRYGERFYIGQPAGDAECVLLEFLEQQGIPVTL